ncbi:MAG: hypothetical protein K8S56_01580 [Candidatus Cloacimonetes bacterium]|nr:hypothetical protein [Candidatus Cloacimonadota bacterium]
MSGKRPLIRIRELIHTEFEYHPEAELIDYYKLFFQGIFGPAHNIEDRVSAKHYLESELSSMTDGYLPLCQEISEHFARISLSVVNKGLLSVDELLELFIISSEVRCPAVEWKTEWQRVESILLEILPDKFNSQRLEILEIVNASKLVIPRHSEIFRRKYSPHYRVIYLPLVQHFL